MNSLLVFTAAVVVALILGRQEARHELSLRLRAHRTGLIPPARKAQVPLPEALLAVVLGLTLLLPGGAMALRLLEWGGAGILRDAAALFLAAGMTLLLLGISAVRSILRG